MESKQPAKPIRVGIFNTIAGADCAVTELLRAGFTKDHISVLCSDEAQEKHFQEFEHQQPAGTSTPAAVATGSAIGTVLGGLAAVAGLATTGGLGVLAVGAVSAWAGAAVGGLVAAMMMRGVDRELADFYQQAVVDGKLLVAAEDTGPQADVRLARAARILADCGAEPIKLQES